MIPDYSLTDQQIEVLQLKIKRVGGKDYLLPSAFSYFRNIFKDEVITDAVITEEVLAQCT